MVILLQGQQQHIYEIDEMVDEMVVDYEMVDMTWYMRLIIK